jgi:two-component system NarL family sensor kinase
LCARLIDGARREPDDGAVIVESERPRTSLGSRPATVARVLAGVSMLLALAGILLHVLPGELPGGDYGAWWITNAVAGIAIALPGGLLAARRPRNPIGWLLLGLALAHGVTVASREYAFHALAPHANLPWGDATLWLSGWTYVDFPFFIALFFLFPDGRLPSRRWAPVLAIGMAVTLTSTVWLATYPGPMLESGAPLNPLPWVGLARAFERIGNWELYAILATMALGIGAMLLRALASPGPARRRILFVAFSAIVLTAELGREDLANTYRGEEYVGAAVLTLFAFAVAVAILRRGLYEIDLVVSRTVVYGGLTIVLGAAYLAAAVAVGMVSDSRSLGSVPAAVVIALLFAPVRSRLQRASDRLLFGERDDPYEVISSLGERLDASDLAMVLPTLAETVAQTLKLPYVAIELERDGGSQLVAERGRLRGEPVVVALTYAGQGVGRLFLGPRTPGERFTVGELRLFEDIARQAAVSAHAVLLTEDLQRSRERLITAREEERRRLHRDLHDGLGPALAGISLQVGSARRLLTRDIVAADGLLAQLADETLVAIADVRRLAYALRPTALDELGLVQALRAQGRRFPGLEVLVLAPDRIENLPGEIEVAAYRIVTEALTNVSRHAGASCCTITVGVNGHLDLEVRDDGSGLADDWRPGIGLASIRARATELGGSCDVANIDGGGMWVRAQLPLAAAE